MNRLRELRKEKKLTQKYLAQKLDVAKLTISRWERGIHQIKLSGMLSSIFGVSIPYLLGIDAENSTNLPAYTTHMLNINNILTDLLRNADKLTAQNTRQKG